MTDHIDGYLSRLAQQVDPAAQVLVLDRDGPRERWVLRRPGVEDLGLGVEPGFGHAKQALIAWRQSERAAAAAHNAEVIRRDLIALDRAAVGTGREE